MEQKTRDNIKEKFLNPPAFARSFPFWAWNGELDPLEIRRQVRQMYEQGIGGFFMHSREGLETEYMGLEWNDCILAAIDEAKKLGMYAWLYDEDRWPSGTAGGKVTAMGDEYRCKGLTLEVCKEYRSELWEETGGLAIYAAKVDENEIYSLRRFSKEDYNCLQGNEEENLLREGEVCLVVRLEVSGPSEWFNNEAPPDNLNPDTVLQFITLTHEKYLALCGDEFGKTVPGIFTDEPSLADTHAKFPPNRSWIPWTTEFVHYFKEKRGYDPLNLIPYLYFNGEYSKKIRHDYWYSIAVRFSESFTKVIGEWCDKHGLALTGHFLHEDKLGLSTRVGGATMPMYEYLQVPGIDMLQEKTDEFMTVKQCASVAHQMGRKHVITETYGCTGWEFTFEGQRHIGDWQYVLGVNRRCQHLALYSIAGCRKRDYPPCFNYNTSWWEKNHVVEDYFARLGAVLEEGEAVQKILLLHPSSTAWSMLGASPYGNPVRRYERDVPQIDEIGYQFNELIEDLCFHHYDMDLGDEIIMSKYAKVEGKSLRIGKACYDTWIIPPIDTMLTETYELLKEFLEVGGTLFVMKPFATMLEGEANNLVSELFQNQNCFVAENARDLLRLLNATLQRTVSIKDVYGNEETHCLALQRTTGEDEILFVVNNDRTRAYEVTIELYRTGIVEEWNVLTGEILPVVSNEEDGRLSFQATLGSADSKLYRILAEDTQSYKDIQIEKDTQRKKVDFLEVTPMSSNQQLKEISSVYAGGELPETKRILYEFEDRTTISCNMENTYTIDRCNYRFKQGEWSNEMEIWEAQKQVREKLQMRPIHLNGIEQRYKWIKEVHPKDGEKLELQFHFEVQDLPKTPIYFAIEHPEYFAITCNGKLVDHRPEGYLLDKNIKKVELNGICVGENIIELHCNYTNAMELEDYYLCGEFGVTKDRIIVAMPKQLYTGDWTTQGFLHYAGAIRYHYTFDYGKKGNNQIYLELKSFAATCVTVYINDEKLEVPWKSASNLIITPYLKEGENKLVIEVFSSPRNLFGPFHLSERKRSVTNDACFRPTGDSHSKNYYTELYGLLEPPRLYED